MGINFKRQRSIEGVNIKRNMAWPLANSTLPAALNWLTLVRLTVLVLLVALGGVAAHSQTRDYAYVTVTDADVVSVVDTVTQTTVATIPVGRYPMGVAFTPEATGKRAYVVNHGSEFLSVIDTQTDTVVGTVPVGPGPSGLAIRTDDRKLAYLTMWPINGQPTDPSVVAVIDIDPSHVATYNRIVATVSVGGAVGDVSISPDNTFAYVTDSFSNKIWVLDITTTAPTVSNTIDIDGVPLGVAIAPDGTFAYVSVSETADPRNGRIWVIDTNSGEVMTSIEPGTLSRFGGIVFAPEPGSHRAYATTFGAGPFGYAGFTIIDTATHTEVCSEEECGHGVSRGTTGIALKGSRLYVTGHWVLSGLPSENVVATIDRASGQVVGRVQMGEGRPAGIAVDRLESYHPRAAYVANSGNTVSIIDTDTLAARGTVNVGPMPEMVAFTPDGKFAYVANRGSDNISVIDTQTRTVRRIITVGNQPNGIAFTSDGALAYVTNENDQSVSVVDTAMGRSVNTIDLRNRDPLFRPRGVAITPDGSRAYVINGVGANVAVIDIGTGRLALINNIGNFLTDIAITRNGAFAYVTSSGNNFLTLIDVNPSSSTYNTVVERINIGYGDNKRLAMSPEGAFVYVTNYVERNVIVINTATRAIAQSIHVGFQPTSVAVTPGGSYVFVTEFHGLYVHVIDAFTRRVFTSIPVPVAGPWRIAAR